MRSEDWRMCWLDHFTFLLIFLLVANRCWVIVYCWIINLIYFWGVWQIARPYRLQGGSSLFFCYLPPLLCMRHIFAYSTFQGPRFSECLGSKTTCIHNNVVAYSPSDQTRRCLTLRTGCRRAPCCCTTCWTACSRSLCTTHTASSARTVLRPSWGPWWIRWVRASQL